MKHVESKVFRTLIYFICSISNRYENLHFVEKPLFVNKKKLSKIYPTPADLDHFGNFSFGMFGIVFLFIRNGFHWVQIEKFDQDQIGLNNM